MKHLKIFGMGLLYLGLLVVIMALCLAPMYCYTKYDNANYLFGYIFILAPYVYLQGKELIESEK